MSTRDAERHGVSEENRHLFVRLDDAKANVALITDRARWFRREGVTIANGDEVGVLVPEALEPVDDTENGGQDDLHRTIIACLLARVSEPEISLNGAGKLLAWGGDDRFAKYRQPDARGNQRVNQTLRRAILAACRSNICIVKNGSSQGFTCDERRKPITLKLKRFAVPALSADIAAQPPEFADEDTL